MNMQNPFTPNFGEVPMHMAGRYREINDFEYVINGGLSAPARTSLYKGARGTGKTVLMSYLGTEAEKNGWICADVTAAKEMREDILQQAYTKLGRLYPQSEKKTLSGLSVAQLLSIEWDAESPYKPTWRTRMNALLDAMQEHDIGLLITIDEIDPTNEEVKLFASDYQHFVRENRKVALLMAGLPENIYNLLDTDGTTFLRRAAQYTIGQVDDADIEVAFRRTIADSGKTIDDEAVAIAVDNIGGQPYVMQLTGFRAWQLAGDNNVITTDNIQIASRLAKTDFEERILEVTYRKLSDKDLVFLNAMLEDETESRIADIKTRMGVSDSYAARYKDRLIKAGVIETSGRGKLTFVSLEMKDYIRKRSE